MWAGHRTFLVGERTVRVGWDDAATAAAVCDATAAWPEAPEPPHLPVTFGVRSVPVGLLRRRIWLVHFGTPVRHRANDLTSAARFVDSLLRSIAVAGPNDGELATALRAYAADGRAVLVKVPDDIDLDERPLRKRGIIQLPTLSAIVRPAESVVVHDGRSFELRGAIIDRRSAPDAAEVDDARRHLMALAANDRITWAWALDRLEDRVVVTDDVARELSRLLA